MKKFMFFLAILAVGPLCLEAANIYHTSGRGDGRWQDPASWVLANTDAMPTTPPAADDHVVISHDIIHAIEGTYVHHGDLEVAVGGHYEIAQAPTAEATYLFKGRSWAIAGTVLSAAHVSLGEAAQLTIPESGRLILIGDLTLMEESGLIHEGSECGSMLVTGALTLASADAYVSGEGRMSVRGDLNWWGAEDATTARIGAGMDIYPDEDACEAGEASFIGTHEGLRPGVAWAGFQVEVEALDAHLAWFTDSEQFVREFTVERSEDGVSYESVMDVPAIGQEGRGNTYRFVDQLPAHGPVKYRIRQTTLSGTHSYSPVQQVQRVAETHSLSIFPNPSRGHRVTLMGRGLAQEEGVGLTIRTPQGALVHEASLSADHNGRAAVTGLPGLRPGLYLVVMTQGDVRLVERLTIY